LLPCSSHTLALFFLSSSLLRPPGSPLFPYTTLFRSLEAGSSITVAAMLEGRAWLLRDGIEPVPLGPRDFAVVTGREGVLLADDRSEEHTSELQSRFDLVCRLLLEKKKNNRPSQYDNI